MDYIYGSLNKLIELQKYKFTSSDDTISTSINSDNQVDLSVNTQQIVTLKQVQKDIDLSDDQIKYYSLYAYNPSTKQFDIKIGDEIVIDTSILDDTASSIESAWVKVGEYQKLEPAVDEFGNPLLDEDGNQIMNPVYDEDGNPVMVPMYQQITSSVSGTGQLMLSQIPASAIIDTTIKTDEYGNVEETYVQSIIDGNVGGIVY